MAKPASTSDVAVQASPATSFEPDLRLELLSQPRFLVAARALISSIAQRIGFNDMTGGQISLAVDEALCNVINHGYAGRQDGRIWISIWVDEPPRAQAGIRLVIEDLARQVDPDLIRSRDLTEIRPGGLGVHIIREIMDEVVYEKREGQGMRLKLVKRVPPGAGSATTPSTVTCSADLPTCCGGEPPPPAGSSTSSTPTSAHRSSARHG